MTKQAEIDSNKKVHPWRLCQYGQCAEKLHDRTIPPSENHPDGKTLIHFYCKNIKSGKDVLMKLEMQLMADEHFSALVGSPKADDLGFGSRGNACDAVIRGWTQYWNEVLKPTVALDPDVPLDPNLVKALIASESGFRPKKLADEENSNSGRGLTQILNGTWKILGDEKGELKNHFVTATKEELNDPNINICAGVRWLFQKRYLASLHSKKSVTWEEAVPRISFAKTHLVEKLPRLSEKLAAS